MRLFQSALLASLILCVGSAYSQPGTIDSNFAGGGKIVSQLGYPYHTFGHLIALQKDGKIILCGDSVSANNHVSFALLRYNIDGSPDLKFGNKGLVLSPMPSPTYPSLSAVAVQKDGKIVTGSYSVADFAFYLSRYLPNGKTDAAFGVNGVAKIRFIDAGEVSLNQLAIQDDGKIVAVGSNDGFAIARCLPNGSMDSSFGVNGIISHSGEWGSITEVAIAKDGKIYTSTDYVEPVTNYNMFRVNRLLPNGDMDDTFGYFGSVTTSITGTGGHDFPTSIALLDNGDILQAGVTQTTDALVKYKNNGTLDASFGNNGILSPVLGSYTYPRVLVQPDGKIIFSNGYVGRLLPNGRIDSAYGTNGKTYNTPYPQSALLLPDGKVLTHASPYSILTRFKGDLPLVSIKQNISVQEGNSGNTAAIFTVVLGTLSFDTVFVNYATADGTALAGKDYVATSGKLVFMPGQTTQTIKVNVIGDKLKETNEKFYLQLQSAKNAAPGVKPTATCTIIDDDATGTREEMSTNDVAALANSVSLYPNPAKDAVFIRGLSAKGLSDIRIVDMNGKTVAAKQVMGSVCRLDIHALPAGTFYITIKNGNNTATLRFIKE